MSFTARRSRSRLNNGGLAIPGHDQSALERFLEVVPDAILGVDREGQIVIANQQAEEIFGYSRTALLGKRIEMLVPERFRPEHAAHRNGYFHDPRKRPMGLGLQLYGLRSDGTEFPAEISLSSIEADTGLIATAAIRDITERVGAEHERERLETELRLNQSRRLESVGQLAGGIAHDFNNLLGLILNYAEFAAAELADRPRVREDVTEIIAAAERAATLTRQLLIFSRREVVKAEPLDLNAVLDGLEKILRRTLGEHVRMTTRFGNGLRPVLADPGQIEQVLINLAVNARDAMPDGGVLEIETANVELDEDFTTHQVDPPDPGDYVRLTVSDSGIGMTPEVAERAFEPFFSTKDETRGTGLGLATVYGIVRQSGGNIVLYSEPGHGTSFKIHLPACEQAVAEDRPQTDGYAPGGQERVLLVEDEDRVRSMVERILGNNGYTVEAYSRGGEALVALADPGREYDLLLTDVVMPEMQGHELVRRALELRCDLPVLYMSGYSDAIIAEQDLDSSVDRLIEKPFTGKQLLRAVRAALDSDGEISRA